MEKKICSYETLYAVNGNLSEEAYKAIEEKFETLIKENATDVTVDEWGKRKFAYPINYVTEGYYVLVNFKSEPTFPLELERVFGITEEVYRYMTTTKTFEDVKPSAKAEPAAAAEEPADAEQAEA